MVVDHLKYTTKEKGEKGKMKKKIFKTAAIAALVGAGVFGLASCNGAPYKDEVIEIQKKEIEQELILK